MELHPVFVFSLVFFNFIAELFCVWRREDFLNMTAELRVPAPGNFETGTNNQKR